MMVDCRFFHQIYESLPLAALQMIVDHELVSPKQPGGILQSASELEAREHKLVSGFGRASFVRGTLAVGEEAVQEAVPGQIFVRAKARQLNHGREIRCGAIGLFEVCWRSLQHHPIRGRGFVVAPALPVEARQGSGDRGAARVVGLPAVLQVGNCPVVIVERRVRQAEQPAKQRRRLVRRHLGHYLAVLAQRGEHAKKSRSDQAGTSTGRLMFEESIDFEALLARAELFQSLGVEQAHLERGGVCWLEHRLEQVASFDCRNRAYVRQQRRDAVDLHHHRAVRRLRAIGRAQAIEGTGWCVYGRCRGGRCLAWGWCLRHRSNAQLGDLAIARRWPDQQQHFDAGPSGTQVQGRVEHAASVGERSANQGKRHVSPSGIHAVERGGQRASLTGSATKAHQTTAASTRGSFDGVVDGHRVFASITGSRFATGTSRPGACHAGTRGPCGRHRTTYLPGRLSPQPAQDRTRQGGDGRNRTDDRGFADPRLNHLATSPSTSS